MDTKAYGEQDCLTQALLLSIPRQRGGPIWISTKPRDLTSPDSTQAWPALKGLEQGGRNGAEGVAGSSPAGLQPRSPKHTPLDTPTTHSTSLHITCHSLGHKHTIPLAVNSHIALHPEKAGHTGSHSTAPSTPLHRTHLLGPKGQPGTARRGGSMATGSTQRISAENSSEVAPAPPGQAPGRERSVCYLPWGRKHIQFNPESPCPDCLTVPGRGEALSVWWQSQGFMHKNAELYHKEWGDAICTARLGLCFRPPTQEEQRSRGEARCPRDRGGR